MSSLRFKPSGKAPAFFFSSLAAFKKPLVFSFFLGVLLLGIFIHRDYGISADERISRINAAVTAKYLLTRFAPARAAADTSLRLTPDLHRWKDRDYGVAFELPVFLLEKALHLKDIKDIHSLHHFCIFLVFWASLVFFYLLVKERYQSWQMGLLGAVFLLLSPRIFADAFYNSKDLVFMSFFIIGLYTMVRFLKQPSWRWAFFHALACAVLINVRILGVLIPLATVAIFVFDFLKSPKNYPFKKTGLALVFYCLALFAFVVLLWPFLWEAPIANFVFAFKNMSKFSRWEGDVIFMGEPTNSHALPWQYAPVWIAVTTPLLYTVLFLSGAFFTLKTMAANRWRLYANAAEKQDFIFLAFFCLPLASVIIFKSVLYCGWRHLYFVYPPLLLVALRGLTGLYRGGKQLPSKFALYALAASIAISIISTAVFMVRTHPYEHMYFGFLPAKTAEKNFDLDYWGLSFKEMVGYVLQHDKSDTVYLRIENPWSEQNSEVFKKEDRDRIHWLYGNDTLNAKTAKPVYFLTAYPSHLPSYHRQNQIFLRSVDGIKISAIYLEK